MVTHDDDLTGFDYPPLNAMNPGYEMSLPQALGDGNFSDNVDMFMDPQFWTMDMSNAANINEPSQTFPNFDLNDLNTAPDQSFNATIRKPSNTRTPYFPANLTGSTSTLTSPVTAKAPSFSPRSPSKRESISKKSAETEDPIDEDERGDLNVSADEDKRRRNTAASARFRVKKKQREQAMEKTAKEMTDKCNALEARVKDLEKENGLLKGLLTARGRGKQSESGSSDEDWNSGRASKRAKVSDGAR